MRAEGVGVDSNVILRWLLRDDDAQAERVEKLLSRLDSEGRVAWVNVTAIAEVVWFLGGPRGKVPRHVVADIVHRLTATEGIRVEQERAVLAACVEWRSSPGNFGEYLISHVNAANRIHETYTFDRRAAKGSRHLRLVPS